MENNSDKMNILALTATLGSMKQLLEVYEQTVIEQTDKLYTEISNRKRVEQALNESEEKYRALIEKSFAGVYIVQMGNFVFMNSQAAAYTGYAPDELFGMKSDFILHPEDRKMARKHARRMLQGERAAPYEFRIVTKDGNVRWIMETVSHIQYEGKPAILGNSMDVTDRMEAEAELKRIYRELDETKDQLIRTGRLAVIGQLAWGAAHEILNPLNIMSLRIQLLESKASLPDDVKKSLDAVKAQITRVVRIVDGLQEFSRIAVGKKEAVQINTVIENVLRIASSHIEAEKVTTNKSFQSDLPLLYVDAGRIEKAFIHIIHNALDAMRDREQRVLTIETSLVRMNRDHSSVRIAVADTGSGIRTEDLSKIFDPFFTTKGPDGGTGLGLTIAYFIIQDHGGTIRAESNESGGATFIIAFPVKEDSERFGLEADKT